MKRLPASYLVAFLSLSISVLAQEQPEEKKTNGLFLKPDRSIVFDTTEGTYMNLDVSSDGHTIVFDLLGDIYVVPISGGEATQLTSGMVYDIEPTYSPDGQQIVFVSDKSGSDNIWVLDAEGKNPRAITKEKEKAVSGPQWSPDGDYILTRRDNSLWLYHKDGGAGLQVTKSQEANGAYGPQFSPDGRWIYFAARAVGEGSLNRLDTRFL